MRIGIFLNPLSLSHVSISWRIKSFFLNFKILDTEIKRMLRIIGILPKAKPPIRDEIINLLNKYNLPIEYFYKNNKGAQNEKEKN